MNLVIFDLETTGWSPNYCDIIQIAAIRMRSGEVLADETFETFVKPRRGIPEAISSLTGISLQDVCQAPEPEPALAAFSRFTGDDILVAHNGQRFDLNFIRVNCERCQIPTREVRFLDSLTLSHLVWPDESSHGLDAVMKRLCLSGDGRRRHNACDDVHLLANAVRGMWERLNIAFDQCPLPLGTGLLPCLSGKTNNHRPVR